MAQFDSMIFTDEFSDYFVAHAKKYTKEQAVETMMSEEWYLWDDGFRKPTINDVREQWCRYYVSDSQYIKKTFVNKEEALDILSHSSIAFDEEEDDLNSVLSGIGVYSYDNYDIGDFEWFDDWYITKHGDKAVVFGYYGYDC